MKQKVQQRTFKGRYFYYFCFHSWDSVELANMLKLIQPSGCCLSKWPHWEYHCLKHECCFFFPSQNCFIKWFYEPQMRTAHIALSSHLVFENYYFIHQASVQVAFYFQKSSSPSKFEDNRYNPPSSLCILGIAKHTAWIFSLTILWSSYDFPVFTDR